MAWHGRTGLLGSTFVSHLSVTMVKSPIHLSTKKVNTTEKCKKVGERHVLLHSTRKYSMHHAGFIAVVHANPLGHRVLASKILGGGETFRGSSIF